MTTETIERERGDDRDPNVSVERLHEIFNQPVVPEPRYRGYVSDAPEVPQAGIGDVVPMRLTRSRVQRVGSSVLAFRRVAPRLARPTRVGPENYLG